MQQQCVLSRVNVVAVHGFPLDWNHWTIHEWPRQARRNPRGDRSADLDIRGGVSTFGAEEVQQFGLRRAAELLIGRAERIHWYSLFDLPRAWPATTRHREAEGSSYYRHFYMGLLREDGTPKAAAHDFPKYTPELGICQWFHFEDHRLDDAVRWLRKLGVRHLRTGLSWADSFRPNAEQLVRSPDEGAGGISDDIDLLLYSGTPRRAARPHQPAARRRRVCGLLPGDGPALCVNSPAIPALTKRSRP